MVRARGVPSVRSRRSFECLLGGIGIEPRGGGALRHHAAVGCSPSFASTPFSAPGRHPGTSSAHPPRAPPPRHAACLDDGLYGIDGFDGIVIGRTSNQRPSHHHPSHDSTQICALRG